MSRLSQYTAATSAAPFVSGVRNRRVGSGGQGKTRNNRRLLKPAGGMRNDIGILAGGGRSRDDRFRRGNAAAVRMYASLFQG